jgi:hypothetical protein
MRAVPGIWDRVGAGCLFLHETKESPRNRVQGLGVITWRSFTKRISKL